MFKFYIEGMNDGKDYSAICHFCEAMPSREDLKTIEKTLFKKCEIESVKKPMYYLVCAKGG
jgi:hypothetical protein